MTPEGKGKGAGEKLHSEQMAWGDTQLEGTGGRDSCGVPCQDGEGAPWKAFLITTSPPLVLPPRIAFSVRISKAAPGLFRSGNLILRWVYFSTLENSQCRTRSRPHPACPPASVLPRWVAAGRVGAAEASWRSDLVLQRCPHAGSSPPTMLGGVGARRGGQVSRSPSVHTPATAA